ncbi:hypothetical protein OHS59_15320 [Streptomyces sp. NBC_00414]|uniref:hypothetical protein n=1 Tax=Streptomyces sp. NBC_00414 TaxID=2975739 RepID=UPI002E202566
MTRVDSDTSAASPRHAGNRIDLRLLELDITSHDHSWAGYDFVVGNHILDDLIISQWDRSRYIRSFGNVGEAALLWRDFGVSGGYTSVITVIGSVFTRLMTTMSPGAVLILREYPATFAAIHGIQEQVELHWRAYHAIVRLAQSFAGTAWEQDISQIPVADGSRLTGGVLCFRRGRN